MSTSLANGLGNEGGAGGVDRGALPNGEASLAACFERRALLHPDRTAVGSGAWRPTYAELNAAANGLGHAWLAHGGERGDRVALLMRHDTPLIAGALSVLKAGRVAVVLNATDPPARLRQVLDDAGPRLILTDATNEALARQAAGTRTVFSVPSVPAGHGAPNLDVPVAPDDVALLIYTSGTTGRPKGVMQTHRNVVHNVFRLTCGLGTSAGDRVVLLASPSGGQGVSTTWYALLNGAALCPFPVMEKGVTGLADWLRTHAITVYVSAASVFRHFTRALDARDRFPQVRAVRLASEPATSDDFAAFRRHFHAGCMLMHTLASTETGCLTQFHLTHDNKVLSGQLPVGRPAAGIEVLLLDEHGQEVAPGEAGEMIVRGQYLSPGYWGNEALTRERFTGSGEARSFRTGDLGYLAPDGLLVFLGRNDVQLKVQGHRIEPAEVEGALRRQLGVAGAVVCAPTQPDGDAQLVAYVTCRVGHAPAIATLRHALRALLPGHMVPTAYVFLDRFPLTPHGKVDREALQRLSPVPPAPSSPDGPLTETEALLAGIWEEIFGKGAIGRDANFFDLGGDSLKAAVVAARAHARRGVELSLRVFADHPTLKALAALIDESRRAGAEAPPAPPVRVSRDEPLPLSYAQERTWMYSQTPQLSAGYTVACWHRLTGPLDVEALRECVEYLSRRHEVLRTTFPEVHGRPVQVVHPPAPVHVPLLDFSDASNPEEQATLFFRVETRRPFDLSQLPLLRFYLIRLREDVYWLLRFNHHINSDEWSWTVYFRELGLLYEAKVRGEKPPLAEYEPLQCGDFAAWQRHVLLADEAHVRKVVAWWKERFSGQPQPLELPFRRPQSLPDTDPSEGIIWWDLDPQVSSRLERVGREENATYFLVRLAAVVALLAEVTGQPEVVLGTYVTNRTCAEVQNIFGFFSNLATLRFRCDLTRTFRQWLSVVRDVVCETLEYGEVPYEQLCAELRQQGVEPPEVRAIFGVSERPAVIQRSGGVEFTWRGRDMATVPWGLTLGFEQQQEPQRCRVFFDAGIYDPAGVRYFMDRFFHFLDAVSAHPGLDLVELRPLWDTSPPLAPPRTEPPELCPAGAEAPADQSLDWDGWYKLYEVSAPLQARLRIVREQIAAALAECRPGPIEIVSICAGDGRDLIEALADHPRRDDVVASLLDTHAVSLARGRAAAAAAGLERQLHFLAADATLARSYAGIVPADLVILSGVLGHLRHEDVPALLGSLPMLCKTEGCLIWNRHLVLNDGGEQVPAIRERLRATGLEELHYEVTATDGFAVGRARFRGPVRPLGPEGVLFEIVGVDRLEKRRVQGKAA